MAEQQIRITFQPHGRTFFVLSGTKIIEVAARAGLKAAEVVAKNLQGLR